jgi:hypothetical protein
MAVRPTADEIFWDGSPGSWLVKDSQSCGDELFWDGAPWDFLFPDLAGTSVKVPWHLLFNSPK